MAVGALRFAPVIGPHVPSPLGRYLRMPAVPFSALADPPFAVVQEIDVAAAFVAAARIRLAEPVNIVAPGAITAFQAIRRGRRLPVPLIGPDWAIARGLSYLAGAPVPDHVLEMMHRGRLADGGRALEVLGVAPTNTTREVIDKLYSWPSVVHMPARWRWRDGPARPTSSACRLVGPRARSQAEPAARTTTWSSVASHGRRLGPRSRLRRPGVVVVASALGRRGRRHDRLPKRGGALIVVNARRFALAPVFAALSIGGAVGRPVRFVGRPDIAPLGPIMQRLGGLLDRADEIAGALRGGQLVVMGADRDHDTRAGRSRRPPPRRGRRGGRHEGVPGGDRQRARSCAAPASRSGPRSDPIAAAVDRSPSSSWPTHSNRRSSNCSTSSADPSPAHRSTGLPLSGIGRELT